MTLEQLALRCVYELNEMDLSEGNERKSVAVLHALRDAVDADRKERRHPPASPVSWARVEEIDGWFHDVDDGSLVGDLAGRALKDLLVYVMACQDRADALECELAMLANDREFESRMREAGIAAALTAIDNAVKVGKLSGAIDVTGMIDTGIVVRMLLAASVPLLHEQTIETMRRYERVLHDIAKLGTGPGELATAQLSNAKAMATQALQPTKGSEPA